MNGFGVPGPGRVGVPAWIAARDNAPSRAQRVGEGGMLRTLSVQTWDAAPIPTAVQWFARETANLNLGALAGATVVTTLAGLGAVLAPANHVTSIQSIVLFCDAPTLTTSILYTVRADQIPIPGLTNLGFPPQAAGFFNFPIPGPWNVYRPGAFIDVLITRVVADVAKLVNFTMVGWFSTPQDILGWTGQLPGQIGG